jgi:hypothetical protein
LCDAGAGNAAGSELYLLRTVPFNGGMVTDTIDVATGLVTFDVVFDPDVVRPRGITRDESGNVWVVELHGWDLRNVRLMWVDGFLGDRGEVSRSGLRTFLERGIQSERCLSSGSRRLHSQPVPPVMNYTLRALFSLSSMVALSASALTQVSLVAHYKLDETSGTVANDSSGNNNHGTYVGGVTLSAPGAAGGTSTAADFDGTTGHVNINASMSLDALLDNFSVAAWVNADVIQIQRIFGNQRVNGPGSGGSWSYGINTAGIRFTTLDRQDYDVAVGMNAGQWYHVAVVSDAQFGATFSLDGVNLGSVAGTQGAGPPSPAYFIGLLDLTILNEYMDGRIDDVQVYSGSLSDPEIASLFGNPGSVIGGGPIGMSYCGPAIPNSSGNGGVITAEGSTLIANNDVTLTASQLPTGQFGYFLAGQTTGFFNPPGSQGIICLSGIIGRYNQAPNIIQGPTGSLQLDLGAIPVSPPVPVVVGDTWYFQCWFRDNNPGLTSNFTDGVEILFQ